MILENTKCDVVIKPTPKKLFQVWLPVFLYAGLIFYLSSLRHVKLPPIKYFDKFGHANLYAMFGVLVSRAFWYSVTHRRKILLFLTFVGVTLYGMSDEWHQSFVPGRSVDAWDVVADAVGGVMGGVLYVVYKQYKKSA